MALDATAMVKWSSKLLADYREQLVYERLFNRDYQGEVYQGGTVKIFTSPIPSDENYVRDSTTISYSSVTPAEQVMEIDERKVVGIKIDELEKKFALDQVWERTSRDKGWELSKSIDTDLSTRLSNAVPSANTLAGRTIGRGMNANAYDLLAALSNQLSEQDVPEGERHVVVTPSFHTFLALDDRYSGFNTGAAGETLRTRGKNIGTAAGMTVHVTTAVPVTSGVYTIIAASQSAATFAESEMKHQTLPPQKDDLNEYRRSNVDWGAKIVQPRGVVKCDVEFASL